jgi:hypothetical protein
MKKKIVITVEEKIQIEHLAKIIHYGLDWHWKMGDNDPVYYIQGGIETIAHIISCEMVQTFGAEDYETGEARDFLKLKEALEGKKMKTVKHWEKKLTQMVIEIRKNSSTKQLTVH